MGTDWRAAARRAAVTIGRLAAFAASFVALAGLGAALIEPTAGPTAGLLPTELASVFREGATLLAGAVLAGVLVRAVLGGGDPRLGFGWSRRSPRELAVGFGIGAGSLALVALALVGVGWVRYQPQAGDAAALAASLAASFVGLAPAAAAEEALFRGYPFQVLAAAAGGVAATALLSGLFALAHARNPNVGGLALANIFLAGVLFSAAYLRTRSLWFASALHLGWNWALGGLFDLPVSGLGLVDTPLYEPLERGPDWVTGGAFGVEGGVAATVAFGVAMVGVKYMTSSGAAGGGRRETTTGDGRREAGSGKRETGNGQRETGEGRRVRGTDG